MNDDILDRLVTAVERLASAFAEQHPPDIMTLEEAAGYMRISESLLREHFEEVPHINLGRRVLFSRRRLMEFVHNGQPQGRRKK